MADYTQIDQITGTKTVSDWEKQFEAYGVKVLTSNWYGGARHFVCNKEVNVPADLNGLKIRTMGSDLCIASVNAMGAVGTAMSQSEIYSGIEQKAIDGCENQRHRPMRAAFMRFAPTSTRPATLCCWAARRPAQSILIR